MVHASRTSPSTMGTIAVIWSIVLLLAHAYALSPASYGFERMTPLLQGQLALSGSRGEDLWAPSTGGVPRAAVAPDEYEDDDTPDQASVVVISDDYPQHHNFHDEADEDWVKFYGIPGEVYTTEVTNAGTHCDAVIELYHPDGATLVLPPRDDTGPGEDEFLEWTCPQDGVYYLRIRPYDPSAFGENTEYDLDVYRPVGPLPGFIEGIVTDGLSGSGIGGAEIKTDAKGSAVSFEDGSYLMVHQAGEFTLSADADGYEGFNDSVTVHEGGTTSKDIGLTPAADEVARPLFSPEPGTYTTPQSVSLSCATADATIYYTTDGSEPTETSQGYSAPIHVSVTTTIKAKAFKSGWAPSETASGIYTILQEPAITVTSPNGGETWQAGTMQDITWTSEGEAGTDVGIDLYLGGTWNTMIVSSTANDGYFSWTVPSTQTPGTIYQIRVVSTADPSIYDDSDGPFTIAQSTGQPVEMSNVFVAEPATGVPLSRCVQGDEVLVRVDVAHDLEDAQEARVKVKWKIYGAGKKITKGKFKEGINGSGTLGLEEAKFLNLKKKIQKLFLNGEMEGELRVTLTVKIRGQKGKIKQEASYPFRIFEEVP